MTDPRPTAHPLAFPTPIRAARADLPAAAAAALRDARALPEAGDRTWVETRDPSDPSRVLRISTLTWGPADGRPLLLVHGVTSSARTFWRLGPALGGLGWRVVAVDLPGHGRTGGGQDGRGFRFDETARLVAGFAGAAFGPGVTDAAGVRDGSAGDGDAGDLRFAVIGHSWGAMLAAHLPLAGIRPARIVLLDPPVMDEAARREMVESPDSRPDRVPERALETIRALKPGWTEGDQVVKAEALTQLGAAAAAAVLLGNGDWDGGLAALADPAARGIPTWIVRGEDATGSLTPSSWLPRFAALIGADHILTVADGEHSPQRQRVEATVVALLTALEG